MRQQFDKEVSKVPQSVRLRKAFIQGCFVETYIFVSVDGVESVRTGRKLVIAPLAS